jgi:hypothetical protein
MTTQHTPAPWWPDEGLNIRANTRGNEEFLVANCGGYYDTGKSGIGLRNEQRANAHIIAAAPEMFDVLNDIITCWGLMESNYTEGRAEDWAHVLDAAQKAIDKAKGGEE